MELASLSTKSLIMLDVLGIGSGSYNHRPPPAMANSRLLSIGRTSSHDEVAGGHPWTGVAGKNFYALDRGGRATFLEDDNLGCGMLPNDRGG
jgi:hypothetical protein